MIGQRWSSYCWICPVCFRLWRISTFPCLGSGILRDLSQRQFRHQLGYHQLSRIQQAAAVFQFHHINANFGKSSRQRCNPSLWLLLSMLLADFETMTLVPISLCFRCQSRLGRCLWCQSMGHHKTSLGLREPTLWCAKRYRGCSWKAWDLALHRQLGNSHCLQIPQSCLHQPC